MIYMIYILLDSISQILSLYKLFVIGSKKEIESRSSRPEVLCKKGVLKKSDTFCNNVLSHFVIR